MMLIRDTQGGVIMNTLFIQPLSQSQLNQHSELQQLMGVFNDLFN